MSQRAGQIILSRRLDPRLAGLVMLRLTGKCLKQTSLLALFAFLLLFSLGREALAQRGGGVTLFGDFKVDESKVDGPKPLSFNLLLYSTTSGRVVDRQTVSSTGRYRPTSRIANCVVWTPTASPPAPASR